MRTPALAALLIAFAACGGDDSKTTTNALADTNQPNVVIPNDGRTVIVSDYTCVEVRDYTDAGEYLSLPGLAENFTPRPHQRSAVARGM